MQCYGQTTGAAHDLLLQRERAAFVCTSLSSIPRRLHLCADRMVVVLRCPLFHSARIVFWIGFYGLYTCVLSRLAHDMLRAVDVGYCF